MFIVIHLLLTSLTAFALNGKVPRLISNTRMSRGYVAYLAYQSNDRLFEALAPVSIPSQYKALLCTVAEVPRLLHEIGKKAIWRLVASSGMAEEYKTIVEELIVSTLKVVKSFASQVSPKDAVKVLSGIGSCGDVFKADVRSVLKKDQPVMSRLYKTLQASRKFRREVIEGIHTLLSSLKTDIMAVSSTDSDDLLKMKAFVTLAGPDAEYSELIAISYDVEFSNVLVSDKASGALLLRSFARAKVAYNLAELEQLSFIIFQGLHNQYSTKLCHVFESLPIEKRNSLTRMRQEAAELREQVKVAMNRTRKLGEATQWWTKDPHPNHYSKLVGSSEEYYELRRQQSLLERRQLEVIQELVSMAL